MELEIGPPNFKDLQTPLMSNGDPSYPEPIEKEFIITPGPLNLYDVDNIRKIITNIGPDCMERQAEGLLSSSKNVDSSRALGSFGVRVATPSEIARDSAVFDEKDETKPLSYLEVVPEFIRNRTEEARSVQKKPDSDLPSWFFANSASENERAVEEVVQKQRRPSRFLERMDLESKVCDVSAMAIRRNFLDEFLAPSDEAKPRKDIERENVRDIEVVGGELVSRQAMSDRRVVSINDNMILRTAAWVDVPGKKRLRAREVNTETLDEQSIHYGLVLPSLQSSKVGIFIPILTSMKTGDAKMCQVLIATDTEMDDMHYNSPDLNRLVESALVDGTEDPMREVLDRVIEILNNSPDQVQKQMLLEKVRELLDSGGSQKIAEPHEIVALEKTKKNILDENGSTSTMREVIGDTYISSEASHNHDKVLLAHELVYEGVQQTELGLNYVRLEVYKGLDSDRYMEESGGMQPWYRVDIDEFGEYTCSAFDRHGVANLDLTPEDEVLLTSILDTNLKSQIIPKQPAKSKLSDGLSVSKTTNPRQAPFHPAEPKRRNKRNTTSIDDIIEYDPIGYLRTNR